MCRNLDSGAQRKERREKKRRGVSPTNRKRLGQLKILRVWQTERLSFKSFMSGSRTGIENTPYSAARQFYTNTPYPAAWQVFKTLRVRQPEKLLKIFHIKQLNRF